MAVTDGYLRSGAKVSSTDGWLHVAGPSGVGPPPFISSSGTLTTSAFLTGEEALHDLAVVASVAALSSDEALADAGLAITVALLSAVATSDAPDPCRRTYGVDLVASYTGDGGARYSHVDLASYSLAAGVTYDVEDDASYASRGKSYCSSATSSYVTGTGSYESDADSTYDRAGADYLRRGTAHYSGECH